MSTTKIRTRDEDIRRVWSQDDFAPLGGWPRPLRQARLGLADVRGYLGSVLWRLQPVPGFDADTLAVDEHYRLFYSDAIFNQWTAPELRGVLYHETLHLLRDHAGRYKAFTAQRLGKGLGVPDPLLWNIAADCSINQDIIKEKGISLPEGYQHPALYGLPPDKTTEEYYTLLEQKSEGSTDGTPVSAGGEIVGPEATGGESPAPSAGKGKSKGKAGKPGKDAGEGAGDAPAPSGPKKMGVCGSLSVVPEPARPELEKLAEAAGAVKRTRLFHERALDDVADAIEATGDPNGVARGTPGGRGIGREQGHLKRWAQQRRAAQTDWRSVLRGTLGDIHAALRGQSRSSYRRPSRRQSASPDVIFASRVEVRPRTGIGIDTSGSMGNTDGEMLMEVARQVPAIVEQCGGDCVAFAVDARASDVRKIGRNTNLDYTGGGGTDMRVAVRVGAEQRPKLDVLIILTDGLSPWEMDKPDGLSVVIGLLATTAERALQVAAQQRVPAWMKVIPIPTETQGG